MPISKRLKRNGLTPRQQRFVSVYLETLNASEAARQSGYKGERADQAGNRMLSYPVVKAEIDKRLSLAIEGAKAGLKKRILDELETEAFQDGLIEDAGPHGRITKANPNKMKALELLAKYAKLLEEVAPVNNTFVIQWPNGSNPPA